MTAPISEPVAPADPRSEVPAAPSAVAGLGWLRGAVSRFANGYCHRRQALPAAPNEIAPGLQMPRRLELRLP